MPQGFSATGSSEQTVTVQPNGSVTAAIQNQPWRATVRWEKLDALTGGRLSEDTKFVLYEWSQTTGDYVVSPNYRVVRLADGTYSVTGHQQQLHRLEEGCVYYTQDNLGKFKIEKRRRPTATRPPPRMGPGRGASNLSLTRPTRLWSTWARIPTATVPGATGWSSTRPTARPGRPLRRDATFTLYEWNAARGVYEVSTNYAIERAADGSYTVACLHPDWTMPKPGSSTLRTRSVIPADTANHDGTTSRHEIFYSDRELANYPMTVPLPTTANSSLSRPRPRLAILVTGRTSHSPGPAAATLASGRITCA